MNVSLSLRKQENRMFFAPNSEVVVDFNKTVGWKKRFVNHFVFDNS